MDTGSKFSFINSKLISLSTKRKISPAATTFFSVNKKPIQIDGVVTILVFIPDLQTTKAIKFHVVKDLPHPAILGMDGMSTFKMVIDCSTGIISDGTQSYSFHTINNSPINESAMVVPTVPSDFEAPLDYLDASMLPPEQQDIIPILKRTKI